MAIKLEWKYENLIGCIFLWSLKLTSLLDDMDNWNFENENLKIWVPLMQFQIEFIIEMTN